MYINRGNVEMIRQRRNFDTDSNEIILVGVSIDELED